MRCIVPRDDEEALESVRTGAGGTAGLAGIEEVNAYLTVRYDKRRVIGNSQLDPFSCSIVMLLPVLPVFLCNLRYEWIGWVRVGEEGGKGEDDFVKR